MRTKKKTKKKAAIKTAAKKRNKPRHSFDIYAKTPGQEKYIKSIETNTVTLCSGPAGSGKAQPISALVLTPTGWKFMGQIKIGDVVSTPNGKSAKVTGVFPQGNLLIYEVRFSDGTKTECCLDHLWLTRTCLDRDAKRTGTVKSTKEILKSLYYGNKRNHSIPMTQPVEFNKFGEIEIDPYLLGLLLGDGCLMNGRVEISSSDEYIINFCKTAHSGVTIKRINPNKYDYRFIKLDKPDWRIKNPLHKQLYNLYLTGKHSWEKFIPREYKYSPTNRRIAILQGLMDSDGTVSPNGHNVTFTSTSYELATDVEFLVQSLGGKCSINRRVTSFTYKGIKKEGRPSFRVNISMPPDINPFRLPRKAERYTPRTKYKPIRYIDSIKCVGEKEAKCILIDSSDHLYLTNDFIVTHNTLIATGMAMKYLQEDPEIKKILIVRPAIEACGESLGYLPGDLDDKMRPFAEPIFDNLRFFIKDEGYISALLVEKRIQISPMSHMRGRTFNNCVVIFDEAQNATKEQMKLFLTRLGRNCKAIVEGDITQSDIPGMSNANNGLADAMQRLARCPDVGVIKLAHKDIFRSKIVAAIIRRYD